MKIFSINGRLRKRSTLQFLLKTPLLFSSIDLLFIGRQKIFIVLSIITLTWIIIEFSNVMRYIFLEKFTYDKEDNLRERRVITQVAFIRKLFIIAILVIAFASILINFESARKIGAGLLTSAGILGIIIGFAAQKSIASLLAGFQIAFTQPDSLPKSRVLMEKPTGKQDH